MKKQLAIAASVLLALGTAVSATKGDETSAARATTSVESASADVGPAQSAQIVALWKGHASSAASVPLARPM